MRIGIVTFHRCFNYGAYWQAHCLADHLKSQGHEVRFLDHLSLRTLRLELPIALKLSHGGRPRRDIPPAAKKVWKFVKAQQGLPRTRTFAVNRPPAFREFDAVVVGSDEVWNLHNPWYGAVPFFFGEGLNPGRLVSYAPSFGQYDAAHGLSAEWAARLRRFEHVSVRDENSARIVQMSTGLEPARVLDPCLQFMPPAFQNKGASPASDFVLVYGYGFEPATAARIKAWAHSKGARVISLGYRNAWADVNVIDAGPQDFLRHFQHARAVATSFFHGIIFSLRFERPFVVEIPANKANKIQSLLGSVGGTGRILKSTSESVETLLETPIDPAILASVADQRRASAAYLGKALAA